MEFFRKLLDSLLSQNDREPDIDYAEFIYIVIPEPLDPLVRTSKYADPIDVELQLFKLGEVSGGGSSLSELDDEGMRQVIWCGVDVDTNDTDKCRMLLRDLLPKLGCLAGTQLQFTAGKVPLQDEFDGDLWKLAQPRSEMHPGFGI